MSEFPLPPDLPPPTDRGGCDHLEGMTLPSVAMLATTGGEIDLSKRSEWVVVFCYPMTGTPGVALPSGWNEIPGARGCTPQACSFRDLHAEISAHGAELYGLSVQSPAEQLEAMRRLHLPYPLLSDAKFAFSDALDLPRFEADDRSYLERVTLIARHGVIVKVFYPVFPPDQNAADVLDWLAESR